MASWFQQLFGSSPSKSFSDERDPASADGIIRSADGIVRSFVEAFSKQHSSWTIRYDGNRKDLEQRPMQKSFRQALACCDDYTHYIVKSFQMTASSRGNEPVTIQFKADYRESRAETEAVNVKAKEIVKALIRPEMNDHQKVKALHDWVVRHFAYDSSRRKHSAYDGIRFGLAVCEGYSLMIYRLLDLAGVPVRIAEGVGRGENHAWNMVCLDGEWYHLDTTWDDPVPDRGSIVSYDYYLLSDPELKKTHSVSSEFELPKARQSYEKTLREKIKTAKSGAQAEFYKQMYMALGFHYWSKELTASDQRELTSLLEKAVTNRNPSFTFRYLRASKAQADLTAVMRQIGVGGRFTIQPFPRSPEPDAVLIEVQFQK